jgi:1-acyl-sn-glycerol-3-phosphate acyltransferase
MPLLRSVANVGHALGWTAFMSSLGVSIYTVTGNRPVFRRMTRFWAEGLARGWGMEVVAEGNHHVDPNGTYVFMANHLSHVDIVALFVALPINVGFLAKKELKMVPFLSQAMVAGGHVFIDRKKRQSAVKAMEEAAVDVAAGASLVVFPEGTRGDTETIQPFKKGGFHLARQANVPVVPVGVIGTRAILPRGGLGLTPGKVTVRVGAPIDPAAYPNTDELAEATRVKVGELAGMPLQAKRSSNPPARHAERAR